MLKFREIGVFLKKTSRDPVGTQSGSSRDPVGIQSGTNFRIFGTTFGPVGKQQKSPKNVQKHCKNVIFYGPKAVPKNAKIGARLGPDWVPTGSRLGPDWIPTGFLQKNTYFPKFEHLFLKF